MTKQAAIHIALVDLQDSTALWEWLARERDTYVLPQEWQQACEMHSPQRRLNWLLGRALRRRILSEVCSVAPLSLEFAQTAAGKPYLPNGPAFNLSHSDYYLAFAWCKHGQLGVDIDLLSRRVAWQKLAQKYLGEDELAAIMSLPEGERSSRFIAHWSIKEAWLKSRGEKIAGGGLARWQFKLNDGYVSAMFTTDAQLRQWHFDQKHVLSCVWQPEVENRLLVPVESCDTSECRLWRWQPVQDQLLAFSAANLTTS